MRKLSRAHGRRPRRYLAQLLRTTPMESLLNRHVDMTTEIKTLDSDMQVGVRRVGSSRTHHGSVADIPRACITPRIRLCRSTTLRSAQDTLPLAVHAMSVARHAKSSCG